MTPDDDKTDLWACLGRSWRAMDSAVVEDTVTPVMGSGALDFLQETAIPA
jgi:hypothetical protein